MTKIKLKQSKIPTIYNFILATSRNCYYNPLSAHKKVLETLKDTNFIDIF